MDPLAEKFYSWSPYTGMNDNPVMFVDPTGMASESTDIEFETSDVVFITGNKKDVAFSELQASVEGQLSLSMDSSGKVTATQTVYGPLTKGASDLLSATTDSSVTVNISATDNDFLSDKSAPLLGAFMGNEFTNLGPVLEVSTFQEINPEALGNMDNINGKPGQTTLHESTESYVGGKLSQWSNTSVGKATPADAGNPQSIYRRAHDNVVPQSGNVTERFYNSHGQEVYRGNPNFNPVKLNYTTGLPEQVFHTVPKKK